LSKKVKKKAKRIQKRNPELMAYLKLPDNLLKNYSKILGEISNRLLEDKDARNLLFVDPKFSFAHYQIVPLIAQLMKKKTIFIRCKLTISFLEKSLLEKNTHFLSFIPFSPSEISSKPMEPSLLLLSTNPFPSEAIWCMELKPYFEAIAATYRLRTNFIYRSLSLATYSTIQLNELNVVTFLSMGKESLWSLSITLENILYEKIIVIFVNNASYGGSYREKQKFIEFSDWFTKNGIDKRVQFHQLNYEYSLIGIQKKEEIIEVNGSKLKEPLCKLQYMQLLCVPLIRANLCGKFIVPQDYKEINYDRNSYFGDHPLSFTSFNSFFCRYIGGSLSVLFQGIEITRGNKTLRLIKINWFQFNSSCYMNWNYFDKFQENSRINPNITMCGVCWKCKIDLKMIKENSELSRLISL
jgi:hypothetical protein